MDAVSDVPEVAAIERLLEVEEFVRFRLVSDQRTKLAPMVSDWLRGRSIPFDEMVVERGSLDDVFHAITEGDGDA